MKFNAASYSQRSWHLTGVIAIRTGATQKPSDYCGIALIRPPNCIVAGCFPVGIWYVLQAHWFPQEIMFDERSSLLVVSQ